VANEQRSGHVYQGDLTKDALAKLLGERFGNAHTIARRVDLCRAEKFDPTGIDSFLNEWDEAQVFNDEAELRWRRTPSGHTVLLLTETEAPPTGLPTAHDSPFDVVDPSTARTHGFLLWGTRNNRGQWWEARIPNPVSYPVKSGSKPPRLVYRLYERAGTVCWVRLVKFAEE
jgi:hypothetical protein